METWRRILCPTDFSSTSRAALRWAMRLGHRPDVEIVILHVVLPMSAYEGELIGWPAFGEAYQAGRRRWAEAAMAKLVAAARRRGVRARGVVVEGSPGREVAARAASIRADLIVIGTRGGHRLRRLLFGSTTEAVIQRAPCPVLAVRPGQRPVSIENLPRRVRPFRAVA